MLIDTLVYSLLTVIVLGPIIKPVLEYYGVKQEAPLDMKEELFDFDQHQGELTKVMKFKKWMYDYNNKHFSPIFVI
jgi:hypothetical protein